MNIIKVKSMIGLLFVVLLVSVSVSLSATLFSGGSGTEYDPWQIATAADLDNVRDYPDSNFIQVADIDLSSYDPWEPIEVFRGIYNGNYFKITSLNVVVTGFNNYGGLIASNEGVLIRLNVDGAVSIEDSYGGVIVGSNSGTIIYCSSTGDVQGYDNSYYYDPYIGGLVGRNEYSGAILESYSATVVSIDEDALYSGAGGLTGINLGTIEDSYSYSNVEGVYDVGGFVAWNQGGTIENCYSAGIVSLAGGRRTIEDFPVRNNQEFIRPERSLYIGGFTGYCTGTAVNSYWDMDSSQQQNSWSGEGRNNMDMAYYPYSDSTYVDWDFVYTWVADEDIYYTGYPFLLRAADDCIPDVPVLFAGGTGTVNDPFLIETADHLNNVRARLTSHFRLNSDIDLNTPPWNDVAGGGWLPIGDREEHSYHQSRIYFTGSINGQGFFGERHTISGLYINRPSMNNQGLFSRVHNGSIKNISLEIEGVHGNSQVGSLAGYVRGASLIQDNYSMNGSIIAEGHSCGGMIGAVSLSEGHIVKNSYSYVRTRGYGNYTGGLIGKVYSGDITDCYSVGEVQGIENNYVGGLIGEIDSGRIQNCYSTGLITASGANIGGLIGEHNNNGITDSYWDIEASGQSTSSGSDPLNNYIGLTTVKMMQQNSFDGFDFNVNNIWSIKEWFTEPYSTYPYLQWQVAGQNPVGIEHNKPENEEPKTLSGDDYYWVSFPWMSRDNLQVETQIAEEVLRPIAGSTAQLVDQVDYWDAADRGFKYMIWDEGNWDTNTIIDFHSTSGYVLHVNTANEIILPLYGTRQDPTTEFTLYPGEWVNDTFIYNENWIGYFLFGSQDRDEAFGDFLDDINFIKSQYGGVYRTPLDPPYDWIGMGQSFTIDYGKMYKVALNDNVNAPITNFHWNIPRGRTQSEREPLQSVRPPKPQHFNVANGPDYESIFITEIADDEDVVEIGVYVDGVCVGASVFEESYPLEILAYTNSTHLNETITFVLYLDDESYERYDTVLLKDLDTGQYSGQTLKPRENLFSIVKLDRTEQERSLVVEEKTEEKPALRISQNYPNPFSLRAGFQGSQTNISLLLPVDMPVSLNIYNIRGQLVRNLVSGKVNKGEHTVGWNGKDENNRTVSSGIYFYKLETDEETLTRKMIIVR